MKRSFDYSFVQLDGARDMPTIPTHSLRQHSATLAAHPLYAPENHIIHNNAFTGYTYMHEDAAYNSAHCLLQDSRMPGGDHELQSNVWYQTITTPERNFWRRVSVPLPTAVPITPTPRRPLTGLGITFGQPQDINFPPPPVNLEYVCKPENLAVGPETALTVSRPRKRKVSVLYADDASMAVDSPISMKANGGSAYSTCPSQDYKAHSPSGVPADPSPFCPSYSPADDVLMLASNTPTADETVDLPHGFIMPTPKCGSKRKADVFSMALDSPTGDDDDGHFGIVADVNFRALALAAQSPIMCVNPADVSGSSDTTLDSGIEENVNVDQDVAMAEGSPQDGNTKTGRRWTSPDMAADFPDEAVTAIVSVLAGSARKEEDKDRMGDAFGMPAPALPQHMRPRQRQCDVQAGSSALMQHPPAFPSRAAYGLGIQFSGHLAGVSHPHSLRPVPHPVSFDSNRRTPLAPISTENTGALVQHRQSPVLNAHEGVELDDLRLRAENFRILNPGCELDKTFLQAFAGRLSERGELLPEFRCYVKGCVQRNKRRDHILVHVGSHVEHRPFQCPQCGMRFLRKNECKRHMSSHGGFKPFTCTLCEPYQQKSFVRQDLLKRHMKVTHGVKPANWPDRRRRAKVEREVESPVFHELMYPEDDCMMDV